MTELSIETYILYNKIIIRGEMSWSKMLGDETSWSKTSGSETSRGETRLVLSPYTYIGIGTG